MLEAQYAAHEELVAPVRPRAALWRLLLGVLVVGAVVFTLNASTLMVWTRIGGGVLPDDVMTGSSPSALLILLANFAFVTVGTAIAARLLQQRGLASILGPFRLLWRQFWMVSVALACLGTALLLLPPYDMGEPLEPNLSFGHWLALLPLSLLAVLIQTSAEEILFRGYLQQSLAARFRSPVIWIGLPSALFAVGHYSTELPGNTGLMITAWAGLFGLLAADLTARSGTLGPAIALHFFNNVIALLFVALPDSLDGLALYNAPYDMDDTGLLQAWLVVDLALMVVAWLAARLVLRR
ncbi:CPBP family intramembrane glutamic endopeptidase [Lutimaribacter marinistellae]|uniref:CPBP family intramembrane glutamic endopeptidase n=1 Tax=Lutimaribacter marinistellae TaxID=1820329 RepID=A0ABV7TCI6_9RHOB